MVWSMLKIALALFGIIAGGVVITKIVAHLAGTKKEEDDVS